MNEWPEWLTPEDTATRDALINEMVRALDHCYVSADASGLSWTMDGLFSCATSNILSRLKASGYPFPALSADRRLSVADIQSEWDDRTDFDDYMDAEVEGAADQMRAYDRANGSRCAGLTDADWLGLARVALNVTPSGRDDEDIL